jgi:nucleoside-diphosphate-sugar epimerase
MKILVLGGNRFFGKKLVNLLLTDNHDVTLLNRGNINDGFGDKIKRLICDRKNKEKLKKTVNGSFFDVVYDQVCYDFNTAKEACEVFQGNVNKYIFTSSQSVYTPGEDLKEADFNPKTHKFENIETTDSDYAEAKRQAEVGFAKHATFPITMVRFPIVIGRDDYTNRFSFHVERIKNGIPIYFPSIEAKISFIPSDFAAQTLSELAKKDIEGPLNVASPLPMRLSRFIEIVENEVHKRAVLSPSPTEENHSPYGIEKDWYMNCEKLITRGISVAEIEDWLPELLRQE